MEAGQSLNKTTHWIVDRHLQSQTHWQLPSERPAPQWGVPKSLALLVFLIRSNGLHALLHRSLTAQTKTPQQPALRKKLKTIFSKYLTNWILDQVAMPLSWPQRPAASASPSRHWGGWWPRKVNWGHVWSIPECSASCCRTLGWNDFAQHAVTTN